MGETRVDLLHLLEDLRDAYPGSTEETILTEIVANALDSGAARIAIDTDATLAVDPAKEHAFITAFLAHWGAAIDRRKPRSRS